jgi:chromosome segregation ATPase
MLKTKKLNNTLERNDPLEDLQSLPSNPRNKDEVESLRQENFKLEFILNKYNFILNEYQLKYGNELFAELDKQLNMEIFESVNNNMAEFKKILVDNVALIKEYEKNSLDKTKSLEFLNGELNRFQIEMEKLIEENKNLREDLESAKEDLNKFYKNVLNENNPANATNPFNDEKKSINTGFYFSKTSNINGDLQANLDLLKNQNEQLLQLVEKYKFESEQQKSLITDYKEKYENLYNTHENLTQDYQKIFAQNEELLNTKNYVEKKIKENSNKMLINDKRTTEALQSLDKFEIQNKFLTTELDHFKEMYEELEKRKNSELHITMCELDEIRHLNEEFKLKISLIEEINSDLKFENNKLKSELQVMKYDCDHMTKILEESNFAVKSAEEKEKHIDSVIKSYKKKIEEAQMEKEKVLVKQRLLEKQINKISEDYSKLLNEKQNQYETFIDSSKDKFGQIINNKDEEISNLKNENLSLKIEKDKYFTEYSIMKKEYDKLSSIFREENEKYMKKYEESEKSANRMNSHLYDKINILTKKCEKLEFEKNNFESEMNMLKSTEKNREVLMQNMNKNDEIMSKDFNRLRERCEILEKEKEFCEKEIERIKNIYETKIIQMKEQYELRVTVLENTLKNQKDDFDATEDKAFEMLKKQENVL